MAWKCMRICTKRSRGYCKWSYFFHGSSLFLTALGLFGLAWYSVESRMKEIGLRKINAGYTKTSCRIVVYPLYQVDRYRVGDRITDGVIPDRTMENAVCIPATTDCLDIYRSSFYRAGRGETYGNLVILEAARVNPAKIIKTD